METAPEMQFLEIGLGDQGAGAIARAAVAEVPVAFEFSGLAYAVMMATPDDLADFAAGFAFAEGLITRADQIANLSIAEVAGGIIIRADLPDASAHALRERLRLRLSEGSCGLCGMQEIEAVLTAPAPVAARPSGDAAALGAAIACALGALPEHQSLSRKTGAAHAAALCGKDGAIIAVREDAGRHNALDKLIGHALRSGLAMEEGFMALSARCSFELVEKAVRAGVPMLVTISAPTALAVERARAAGLTLVTLARRDTALVASDPAGIFGPSTGG